MTQPPVPVPAPPRRPLILGLSRSQMAFAFLAAVCVYMIITFMIPGLLTPVWQDLSWRDVLTLAALVAVWAGIAVYNRLHPDEEIRLNLGD